MSVRLLRGCLSHGSDLQSASAAPTETDPVTTAESNGTRDHEKYVLSHRPTSESSATLPGRGRRIGHTQKDGLNSLPDIPPIVPRKQARPGWVWLNSWVSRHDERPPSRRLSVPLLPSQTTHRDQTDGLHTASVLLRVDRSREVRWRGFGSAIGRPLMKLVIVLLTLINFGLLVPGVVQPIYSLDITSTVDAGIATVRRPGVPKNALHSWSGERTVRLGQLPRLVSDPLVQHHRPRVEGVHAARVDLHTRSNVCGSAW